MTGQANALCFAARQGVCAAVEAQIVQAHIVQELQARANLAHHFVGNFGLGALQFQSLKVGLGFTQSDMVDFINGARLWALTNPNMACFAPQTRAFAIGASVVTAHACKVFAHHAGVGFFVAPCEVGNDPFKGVFFGNLFALGSARLHDVTELDVFFARAPQNAVAHGFWQ